MFRSLSLRLRILLFFVLLGLGAISITFAALFFAFTKLSDPAAVSALTSAAAMAGFGILGLTAFVWLLFDENVAKAIEGIASGMRARAFAGVDTAINHEPAKYLGDLAPAAAALSTKLSSADVEAAETLAEKTARLEAEKAQLAAILSDIPVAVLMVGGDHRITLYDGHAVSVLEEMHPLGLGRPVFDYIDENSLRDALAQLLDDPERRVIEQQLVSADGARLFETTLHQLGEDGSYMVSFSISKDAHVSRPIAFDFDLNTTCATGDILDVPLRQLSYVVFDTETTGLLPQKDEVVQIGALRVVNCQSVEGEALDTLVDPKRPIPASSTEVHGINDTMVQGAPDMVTASKRFHGFARGSVLVAHNAPFDMAFFKRYAPEIGENFDNPVLDTVLLSAVLFGGSAVHTLDALAERLNVTLAEEVRHTAMGDAIATRDVLLKMIPLLESRNLITFGQVLGEMRKHKRLLPDLNEA